MLEPLRSIVIDIDRYRKQRILDHLALLATLRYSLLSTSTLMLVWLEPEAQLTLAQMRPSVRLEEMSFFATADRHTHVYIRSIRHISLGIYVAHIAYIAYCI